jgi:cytidylate kinase
MRRPAVIALDGPAGAGKSTVGQRLAQRLGYFYFDTGALYRAVAVCAIEQGIDPGDEAALERLVGDLDVVIRPSSVEDGRQYDVLVHGHDVSRAIRGPEVDRLVSVIAASPAVRRGLIEPQRRQVQGLGTVMAGRDIGTVVCPDADLKVYLDASATERARRRLRQSNGPLEELDAVRAAIKERDRLDSSRALAPLARAEDAVLVATDGLSIDQVVERILELAAKRCLPGARSS